MAQTSWEAQRETCPGRPSWDEAPIQERDAYIAFAADSLRTAVRLVRKEMIEAAGSIARFVRGCDDSEDYRVCYYSHPSCDCRETAEEFYAAWFGEPTDG
jgi:hypothetical protein